MPLFNTMGTPPTDETWAAPGRVRRRRVLAILGALALLVAAPAVVDYVPLDVGQETTPQIRVAMDARTGPDSIRLLDPTEGVDRADPPATNGSVPPEDSLVHSLDWQASTGDIDGDGLGDVEEMVCGKTYPGADPFKHDIYIELDTVRGTTVSDEAIGRVEAVYANASIRDPVGYRGINLHILRSDRDLPRARSVTGDRRAGTRNDIYDYRRGYMDHRDHGYYYILVTTEVQARGDPYFSGVARTGVGAIETYNDSSETASLIAHELGHMFGIDESERGVDNHTYSLSAYPSVMNYNGLYEIVGYSNGSGAIHRDEWHRIAHERPNARGSCLPTEGNG